MNFRPSKKLPVSGLRAAFLVFFFFAMKRCPIAGKIAGSIRILPCCVLTDFFNNKKEKSVTAPILKPTYDQKPETFVGLTDELFCVKESKHRPPILSGGARGFCTR